MVIYKQIDFQGLKFNIPERDTQESWNMSIAMWLNTNASVEMVQKAIYETVNVESLRRRENNLKKLLYEDKS